MDTLLFIAIVGIASIIKIFRAAAQKEEKPTNAPTPQEREDIERRIREILGQPSVQTAPAQTATTSRPSKSRVVTPQSQAKPKAHTSSVTYKATTTTSKTDSFKAEQPQQAVTNPPLAKSEIEGIMEDFSLERAVIYSEILEPKFKEY
jgi:cytoskeletal protein RodZ